MFGRRQTLWIGALCLMWLLTSCTLLPSEEAVAPPIIPAEEVEYNTAVVEKGPIAKVVTKSGTLISPNQHNLSFEKRGGYLTEMSVRSGAQVKEGDILASIDTESIAQQVAEQEIAVRIARINYNEALEAAGQDTSVHAVQRAKANLDLARLRLNNVSEEFESAVIRSPIDGQVTYAASSRVGDFVQARTTMFTVSDESELVVIITGEANDLIDLTLDMQVDLEYMRENYTGFVTMTPSDAPKDAYYSTKPYVVVDFDVMPEKTTIGHAVRVSFNKEAREDAILVPINAVTQYGGYSYVRVLQEGVSRERPVELGITTSTQAEIVSGLEPGELVVIR